MTFTVDESYRLRKMAQLVASQHRVLDIGCTQLPNLFLHNPHVSGLDVNQGELPDNYHELILGTIASLAHSNKSYDAIVAGELLEHIENPIVFLKECYNTLNDNGTLVLSTPNPHSPFEWLLNLTLNKKYFYTSDHIMLFPQRWLIRMLETAGFSDVHLYSGGLPIPGVGLIPFPRPFCHQTIAVAKKNNV